MISTHAPCPCGRSTNIATSMDECGSSHDVETCTKPPLIERNWPVAASSTHCTHYMRRHVAPNRTLISTFWTEKRVATARPRGSTVHREINGRDLKSGNLDAARAAGKEKPRPMAGERAQTVTWWGEPPRNTDIIFSWRTLFSFLFARSSVQPTAEVKWTCAYTIDVMLVPRQALVHLPQCPMLGSCVFPCVCTD